MMRGSGPHRGHITEDVLSMLTLMISEKGGPQSRLDFNKVEITIGRMKGNDIVLPRNNISKHHSSLRVREGHYYVEDHNSTNGTYVNGRRINGELMLSEGDKVFVGDFVLDVDMNPASASTPPPSVPPLPVGARHTGPQSAMQHPEDADSGRPGFETLWDPGSESKFGGSHDPLRATYTSSPDTSAQEPITGDNNAADLRRTMSGSAFEAHINASPAPPIAPPSPPPALPTPPPVLGTSKAASALGVGAQAAPQRPVTIAPEKLVPATPKVAPIKPPRIHSEFDADFFVAQREVAAALLEQLSPEALPQEYPASEQERALMREAVDAAIEASAPEGVEREVLAQVLLNEGVGLGVLDALLDDPTVRDIYVNRYDQILLRREGQLFQSRHVFSSQAVLERVARRLLGESADMLGADEVRFGDGTRVHVVMPPMAVQGPLITARKPPVTQPSLGELVQDHVLSPGMAEFLMRAIDAGRSIAVCGPTGAGKSTALSALASLIPDGTRLIAIEDYSHVKLPQGSAVRLEASPVHDKRFLLRQAVAMHPQRIVLDECRGAEAYDWITSVTSGTEGSMVTLQGASAPDALQRMESLCLLANQSINLRGLREQIARAVQLLVVVNRVGDGQFRVQQITEVQGVDLDTYRLNDIFYFRAEGPSGAFHPTGYIPLFYEDLRHAGVDVDLDIFRE